MTKDKNKNKVGTKQWPQVETKNEKKGKKNQPMRSLVFWYLCLQALAQHVMASKDLKIKVPL